MPIRMLAAFFVALFFAQVSQGQTPIHPPQNLDRDTLRVGDTLRWSFKVERVLRNMEGMEVRESKYEMIVTEKLTDTTVKARFKESHDPKRDKAVYKAIKEGSSLTGKKSDFTYTPNPFENGAATIVVNAITGKLAGTIDADSVIPYYRIMYLGYEPQPTKEQFLQFTASNLERFWIQLSPDVPDSVIRTSEERVEFRKTTESTVKGISLNPDGSQGKETAQTNTTTTIDQWEIQREADTVRAISSYVWTVTNKIGERNISTRRKLDYDTRWHHAYPAFQEFMTEGFGDPGSTRITIIQDPWRRKK